MFVTVTEIWDYWHTDDQRIEIHDFLDIMEQDGKFIRCMLDPENRSTYNGNGAPTKTFTSLDSANEYIGFYKNWQPPVNMIINTFNTKEECISYLESVTGREYTPEPGPQHE
jgi:hypothetical protein